MVAWCTIGNMMKQRDLDLMSFDELFMLYEQGTATLAARSEKEALVHRLKQADMRAQ
jgi:hypothetical protein